MKLLSKFKTLVPLGGQHGQDAEDHYAKWPPDAEDDAQRRRSAGGRGGRAPGGAAPARPAAAPEYASLRQFHSLYLIAQRRDKPCSSVHRAQCCATGAAVCLKVYPRAELSDKDAAHLAREVALMRRLRGDPGVPRLLGYFEDGAGCYIVMEYCPGGDLYRAARANAALAAGSQSAAARRVVAPLLATLGRLHAARIVHRDVKPENVLFDADGRVRLADFGLAIDSAAELPFLRAGTLDFMAPEVLNNPVPRGAVEGPTVGRAALAARGIVGYGEKVDVWGVGCLAYELVVGEPPFYHDDPEQTRRLIAGDSKVYFPRALRGGAFADFVRAALTRDPRARPTADELARHAWLAERRPSAGGGAAPGAAAAGAREEAEAEGEEQPPARAPAPAPSLPPRLAKGAAATAVAVDATGAAPPPPPPHAPRPCAPPPPAPPPPPPPPARAPASVGEWAAAAARAGAPPAPDPPPTPRWATEPYPVSLVAPVAAPPVAPAGGRGAPPPPAPALALAQSYPSGSTPALARAGSSCIGSSGGSRASLPAIAEGAAAPAARADAGPPRAAAAAGRAGGGGHARRSPGHWLRKLGLRAGGGGVPPAGAHKPRAKSGSIGSGGGAGRAKSGSFNAGPGPAGRAKSGSFNAPHGGGAAAAAASLARASSVLSKQALEDAMRSLPQA